MIRSAWSYAVVAGCAGIALAAAGCSDEGPAAPEQQPLAPAAAVAATGDRYIVLMKEGTTGIRSTSGMTAELGRMGARIERSNAEAGVLQARLNPAAAAQLAQRADVEAVVKDRTVRWLPPSERAMPTRRTAPTARKGQTDAAFFDEQWNLQKVRAPRAWHASNQGRNVTVCILDSGVDPRQVDMAGKLDQNLSASFVASERADRDFNLHGTAMASIVTTNGLGIGSIAPNARVCSVKVLDGSGSGTFGDVIAGIMYVGTAGVDVANMSLGATIPADDPDAKALARAVQRAINFSTKRGVLFVASSGNEGINFNDGAFISVPSGLDHVISVGATGPINQKRFDHLASYGNIGRTGVDVFAPGGEFQFPANVADDLILVACSPSNREPGFEYCAGRTGFLFVAGTSPSAAHVSGEAAVLEAQMPGDQTPAELTACILASADPLPNPVLSANGRINVFNALSCGSAARK